MNVEDEIGREGILQTVDTVVPASHCEKLKSSKIVVRLKTSSYIEMFVSFVFSCFFFILEFQVDF